MFKRKNILKIAIDSPAAAGAGTLAKAISKHYNLLYVDTGKAYRLIALYKLKDPKNFNLKFIEKKIKNLKIKDFKNKLLLSDKVSVEASNISKNKGIRKLIYSFQTNFAYNPPSKYNGSCLDGRDITYKIIPDADFKFFITANVKTRAMRRFKELKHLDKTIKFADVLKSIKKRDKSDYNRKISPLKKTKDSVLLNTSKLTKRACFLKIKKIIDRKINS